MRIINLILVLTLLVFTSCSTKAQKENRIYVKSVRIDTATSINWYMYSLIGGFSKSYLAWESKGTSIVLFADHYLTNFNIDSINKLIKIETTDKFLGSTDFSLLKLPSNYKVLIERKGFYMNEAINRFSRLKNKSVNITEPHFSNSDF
jgi:hypothetical protein